jgi:hypothetical protein
MYLVHVFSVRLYGLRERKKIEQFVQTERMRETEQRKLSPFPQVNNKTLVCQSVSERETNINVLLVGTNIRDTKKES